VCMGGGIYLMTLAVRKEIEMGFEFLIISAAIDFIFSAIPIKTPIKTFGGAIMYNDAQTIVQLYQQKKWPVEYKIALELFNSKKFSEALPLFKTVFEKDAGNLYITRICIRCALHAKQPQQAIDLSEKLIAAKKASSDDYVNAGLAHTRLKQHEKALFYYDRALRMNAANKYSLNNKGYTYILLEKYNYAIEALDKAIDIDDKFAYAWSNRGLAKIKTYDLEGGYNDLTEALKLDETNSYAHRNLGIYYIEKEDYLQAATQFKKAKELDADTEDLDTLIGKCELALKKNSQ
jgi:tetratricopeptide (TPR) repeat protein